MAQVIRSPKTYDVCIVGSGAAGGTAAKILTEGGLSVVMLEAGPPLNPAKDFNEDVSPYYDKVESYIGVFGTKEGVSSAPDGIFMTPPKPRCTELIVKKACDKLNITCIPSRLAIITQAHNDRAACHYCGQCGRGCVSASN